MNRFLMLFSVATACLVFGPKVQASKEVADVQATPAVLAEFAGRVENGKVFVVSSGSVASRLVAGANLNRVIVSN